MLNTRSTAATVAPAVSPVASSPSAPALLAAAEHLLPDLVRGAAIEARTLRAAMEFACGGSDAEGAWSWKDAYEVCELAQLLFLRRFGPALRARPIASQLAILGKVAALLPTHTRRSEESQALQQFSTPIPLGLVAARAAAITAGDLVLEPSAGTGLLAAFADLAGAPLVLNELADTRADLLDLLFPAKLVTRFDAAQIHDHLDADVRPSVVLMNPPFSVGAHVEGRVADATIAISPPPWRGWRTAAGWSPSPAHRSRPTPRPGRLPSSSYRSAGAWCSARRWTAAYSRGTARRSRRG